LSEFSDLALANGDRVLPALHELAGGILYGCLRNAAGLQAREKRQIEDSQCP
jgi:hypothetical protein